MAINPVDQNIFDQLGLTKKPEVKSSELGQSEFLKLMTAQLNNQDPMKPMENGEFFNQIAQFSSVSGIQDLQKTFSHVADIMTSGQTLQATSLIGRNVLINNNRVMLGEEGNVHGSVELEESSDRVMLNIYTTTGKLVNQYDLGPNQKGSIDYTWSGLNSEGVRMPPGSFVIEAEARYGKNNVSQQVFTERNISSVSLGDSINDIKLNLSDDTSISIGEIRKIQ